MWTRLYHEMLRRISTLRFIATARKNARVRIETDHFLVIRRRHSTRAWCQQCDREVDVVRAEEAAALAETSQRALREGVVSDAWHIFYAPGGAQWICLNSLLKSL